MEWTDEDRAALLSFKNTIDCDDIKVKESIKKILLNNRFIVHVLGNEELESEDAEPEDYFGVNILPYYMIPTTVTNVKVFLCYEVGYTTVSQRNSSFKELEIVFHILCYKDKVLDKETGVARHDMLAALLIDQFNFTNYMGNKIELVSDSAGTMDNDYCTRTLTFQQITDNNLVKSKIRNVNGDIEITPRLSNKL